jgi:hypothetical protein
LDRENQTAPPAQRGLRKTIDARETALAQVTRHPAPYSIYRYPAFC